MSNFNRSDVEGTWDMPISISDDEQSPVRSSNSPSRTWGTNQIMGVATGGVSRLLGSTRMTATEQLGGNGRGLHTSIYQSPAIGVRAVRPTLVIPGFSTVQRNLGKRPLYVEDSPESSDFQSHQNLRRKVEGQASGGARRFTAREYRDYLLPTEVGSAPNDATNWSPVESPISEYSPLTPLANSGRITGDSIQEQVLQGQASGGARQFTAREYRDYLLPTEVGSAPNDATNWSPVESPISEYSPLTPLANSGRITGDSIQEQVLQAPETNWASNTFQLRTVPLENRGNQSQEVLLQHPSASQAPGTDWASNAFQLGTVPLENRGNQRQEVLLQHPSASQDTDEGSFEREFFGGQSLKEIGFTTKEIEEIWWPSLPEDFCRFCYRKPQGERYCQVCRPELFPVHDPGYDQYDVEAHEDLLWRDAMACHHCESCEYRRQGDPLCHYCADLEEYGIRRNLLPSPPAPAPAPPAIPVDLPLLTNIPQTYHVGVSRRVNALPASFQFEWLHMQEDID